MLRKLAIAVIGLLCVSGAAAVKAGQVCVSMWKGDCDGGLHTTMDDGSCWMDQPPPSL